MSKPIIRRFKKEDSSDMAEIFRLVENDPRTEEDYERWANYPDYCVNLIAEIEGKAVGRLLIDSFYEFYPELVNFAIHPDYQGQGIGKQLISYALKQFEANNLVIPSVKVDVNNERAKHLYRKFGFLRVIPGTFKLNEWRLKLKSFSLVRVYCLKYKNYHCSSPKPLNEEKYTNSREINLITGNEKEMVNLVQQYRQIHSVAFTNDINADYVTIHIIGQPDQPYGKINGKYCAPGFPPSIFCVKAKFNELDFEAKIISLSEKGKAKLTITNNGNSPLKFNIDYKTTKGVFVKGKKNIDNLKSNQDSEIDLMVVLNDEFNPNDFNYTSFEAIQLTVILKEKNNPSLPFHLSINFWYRMLFVDK